MELETRKEKLIKELEQDTIDTNESKRIFNTDEISDYIKRLIKISKKEDKSELYNLSVHDIVLICITISYDEKPYGLIKEKCAAIKDSLNKIGNDANTLLLMNKFIDAIDNHKEDEYPRYLKRLGLDNDSINDLINIEDYAMLFKPLFLLLAFKNGYEKAERIYDKRTRKLAHQQNYDLTIKDFIYFISNFSDQLFLNVGLFDKRVKLNNEIESILKDGDILSLIPLKEEYLEYLSSPVLNDLLILLGEILNYSYCLIEGRICDLKGDLASTQLNKFLYAIGIIPESIDKDLYNELSKVDFSTLEKRAKFLFSLDLSPKDILTTYSYYLKTLDLSVIDKIKFYLESNIISKDYIKNKISEVSTIFSKIDANYEILKPIIDFSNIYYNESILFEDLNTIKNRLSVLAEYNLTKNNFTFLLVNYEYLNIYDLMLENEIPLYLFINICHTTNPELTVKRILLFKELNIPYETPTHELTKEVRFEKYFVCSNEELEHYFPSNPLELPVINGEKISDIKQDKLIKGLEENNAIDDTYMIGNTVISRPKLLRNLQYLKDNNIEDDQHKVSSFLSNSIVNRASFLDISKELNIQKSYLL